MKAIRPIGDKILVKKCKKLPESTGGIIIPDSVKQNIDEAIVVATGPGVRYEDKFAPLQVKKGDLILCNLDAQLKSITLSNTGDSYSVIKESAIIAILEEIPDDK